MRLAEAQAAIADLETALTTSRTIGIAIGRLVERYAISPAQAFARLSRASAASNRKVRDVAKDFVESGLLPDET